MGKVIEGLPQAHVFLPSETGAIRLVGEILVVMSKPFSDDRR